MAKVTISRIFELSRYLGTKSGQELKDALVYISELAEVSLRLLRNGLTFNDNFDCETKTVYIRTNVETVIAIANRRRPSAILVKRVINDTYYEIDSYGWKFSTSGDVIVKIVFSNSPASTLDIPVEILLLFG
jgi:hypothetical protein